MVKKVNEIKNSRDYANKYQYVYNVLFKNSCIRQYDEIYVTIGQMVGNTNFEYPNLLHSIFFKASDYLKDIYDIDVISYNEMFHEIRIATNKEYSEDEIILAIGDAINEKIVSPIMADINRIKNLINKFNSFSNSDAIEIYEE